jgi:hypothetical protein
MKTMGERSLMWRTTHAFGAFVFALMLVYFGALLGNDAHRSIVFRILTAGPLLLGACLCLISALREMRIVARQTHAPP